MFDVGGDIHTFFVRKSPLRDGAKRSIPLKTIKNIRIWEILQTSEKAGS